MILENLKATIVGLASSETIFSVSRKGLLIGVLFHF